MKHRKLRIAWSVAWGIAVALLIALWVQSYWYLHRASIGDRNVTLVKGHLVTQEVYGMDRAARRAGVRVLEYNFAGIYFTFARIGALNLAGVGRRHSFWPLVASTAGLAAVPWVSRLPWSKRFSLRTLLIATTVAAVGLGTVVWLSR